MLEDLVEVILVIIGVAETATCGCIMQSRVAMDQISIMVELIVAEIWK